MTILDEQFGVVLAPPTGALPAELLALARTMIERPLPPVEVSFHGHAHLVTVSRLQGRGRGRYALLVQPRGRRNALANAAVRFMLTPREAQVLRSIVRGLSNREIASKLHIVEATVQDHVRKLCAKTGARRRGDLLARVFAV